MDYRESKFTTLINKYESHIHAAVYWTAIDNTSIHGQIKSTVIKYLNLKKLRIRSHLLASHFQNMSIIIFMHWFRVFVMRRVVTFWNGKDHIFYHCPTFQWYCPCSLISFQISIGTQFILLLNKQLKLNRNVCIMLYKFK